MVEPLRAGTLKIVKCRLGRISLRLTELSLNTKASLQVDDVEVILLPHRDPEMAPSTTDESDMTR